MSILNQITSIEKFVNLPDWNKISVKDEFDVFDNLKADEKDYFVACRAIANLKSTLKAPYLTESSTACVYLAEEVKSNTLETYLQKLLFDYAVIFTENSLQNTEQAKV
jgi:imidazoleglycerol phosphate synthase glutamine amidotransferase subunit HisH